MSFGNNVFYYRKKFGITQEALAEKLDVTRQTVSRWETDNAFPDMEKLLVLCDLFECDMEILVRGDAEEENSRSRKADLEAYDRHMNGYTAQITAGVVLILLGVTAMLFLYAAGVKEVAALVTLLSCITVAVAIFVAGGVAHANFMRENPQMTPYPEEKARAFRRKMPYFIAGAVALILLGIIAIVAMTYQDGYAPKGFTAEEWEYFAGGVFLGAVTVGTGLCVYAGMQWEKYEVKNYNKECRREGYAKEEQPENQSRESRAERISGAVCGAIMLTATAIYLPLGFIWNFWHPGWVVFPVGGILCAVVSTIARGIHGDK